MSDWRTIDSAPRDTLVLLFDPFEGIVVGRISDFGDWWMPNPTSAETEILNPTHWAPLPRPPRTNPLEVGDRVTLNRQLAPGIIKAIVGERAWVDWPAGAQSIHQIGQLERAE